MPGRALYLLYLPMLRTRYVLHAYLPVITFRLQSVSAE